MENGDTIHNETERVGSEKPIGATIGTIIIVLVLIIGAFYFWGSKLEKGTPLVDENVTAEEVLAKPDASLDTLKTQGASDEIDSIEQDLNATDLQNLNAESANIDAELAI